jgi:hypothetical protein
VSIPDNESRTIVFLLVEDNPGDARLTQKARRSARSSPICPPQHTAPINKLTTSQVCYHNAHLNSQTLMAKSPKENLLEQERFELKAKSGGGLLSYEVWGYVERNETVVTRYNLAYINHAICQGDNGRVLGFDNAHGYHHRHFMGNVEAVEFESYAAIAERFQQEWLEIVNQMRGKKP